MSSYTYAQKGYVAPRNWQPDDEIPDFVEDSAVDRQPAFNVSKIASGFLQGFLWPAFTNKMISEETGPAGLKPVWSTRFARMSGVVASSAGIMMAVGSILKTTISANAILKIFAFSIAGISTPVFNVVYLTLIAAAFLLVVALLIKAVSSANEMHKKNKLERNEALIKQRVTYEDLVEEFDEKIHPSNRAGDALLHPNAFSHIVSGYWSKVHSAEHLSVEGRNSFMTHLNEAESSNRNAFNLFTKLQSEVMLSVNALKSAFKTEKARFKTEKARGSLSDEVVQQKVNELRSQIKDRIAQDIATMRKLDPKYEISVQDELAILRLLQSYVPAHKARNS